MPHAVPPGMNCIQRDAFPSLHKCSKRLIQREIHPAEGFLFLTPS